MIKQSIRIHEGHKPIFCHDCKARDSFERYTEGDIKPQNGEAFLLKWRCRVCGHSSLTTNKEFQPEY